jgi:hypothetical protein
VIREEDVLEEEERDLCVMAEGGRSFAGCAAAVRRLHGGAKDAVTLILVDRRGRPTILSQVGCVAAAYGGLHGGANV